VSGGSGSLVLNATYEPLCVVTLRRAVVLVLAEKAIVVEAGDLVMHSAHMSMQVPSVVRLSRYVRVPYRREVPMTRRAVLDRDGHRCGYCGLRADTIDHVRPRSRGGLHAWTNVVAACARCNHRKGDRLLSELGWHLPSPPTQPPTTVAVVMGWAKRDPSWEPYLTSDWGRLDVAPAV
jgi:5-methylcytosine-specific restriction endonuclease McrA